VQHIRALRKVWLCEKDDTKHLLNLEEGLVTTRRLLRACIGRVNRHVQDLRAEAVSSRSERLDLDDDEDQDREEHWQSFLGTILVQAELVCQQWLKLLHDLDGALDEIYQDTGSGSTSAMRSSLIGDAGSVGGGSSDIRIDRIVADLQRSQQALSEHPMVQMAKSLVFDWNDDASQLLRNNTGSSTSGHFLMERAAANPPRVFIDDAPPMHEVLDAPTPLAAFQRFCHGQWSSNCDDGDDRTSTTTSFTIISISGEEGTGKTYCLDQMEEFYQNASCNTTRSSSALFRPSVPLDFLLPVVGETENAIIAMFGAAVEAGSCAILLDNADEFFVNNKNNGISHVAASCLLSTMASLQQSLRVGASILIVVCSTRPASKLGLPANKTFQLSLPDADQRRAMIERRFLGFNLQDNGAAPLVDEPMQQLTFDLAEMTSGRSYADLSQFIRQAYEQVATSQDSNSACPEKEEAYMAMMLLKDRLSKFIPPSLRIGRLDSEFDAVVLSGADLTLSDAEASAFPFKGRSAAAAFQALNRTIVVPFCQYQRLQYLCGTGICKGTSLLGGVLLSGVSGCGKSALAMHCAKRIAAKVTTVTVLVVNCTSLIHKEVGGSEQAVRRLFAAARQASPCVVVLEGIENIGATRGNDCTTEGTMDRVLSTLLVELDGIGSEQDRKMDGRLAIIATTIEESWVDAALKRPGRLGNAILLAKDWR
jgi:SpoVK/Ycf46/Vps4 family AAA+-type ATPase